jgi:hypothetical protein
MESDMKTQMQQIRTIDLGYDQLMLIEGGPGERVRVLFGATWLTQEGESGDAFLRPGDELPLGGGRTLVGALEPTRLQMLGCAQPVSALRRLATTLRHWATRLQLGPVQPEPTA